MRIVTKSILACAGFSAVVLFTSPSYAAGGCAALPDSEWWGKTSHDRIISYVSRKHQGDWLPYVRKWGGQLNSMQEIQKRGGVAIFKSKGLTLTGDSLQMYIDQLVVRVAVTECLSRHAMETARKTTKPDS